MGRLLDWCASNTRAPAAAHASPTMPSSSKQGVCNRAHVNTSACKNARNFAYEHNGCATFGHSYSAVQCSAGQCSALYCTSRTCSTSQFEHALPLQIQSCRRIQRAVRTVAALVAAGTPSQVLCLRRVTSPSMHVTTCVLKLTSSKALDLR